METLKILIKISKNAAIDAGASQFGEMVVDVDVSQFSPEEREILKSLKMCTVPGHERHGDILTFDTDAVMKIGSYGSRYLSDVPRFDYGNVTDGTTDSLKKVLHAYVAWRATLAEAVKVEQQKMREEEEEKADVAADRMGQFIDKAREVANSSGVFLGGVPRRIDYPSAAIMNERHPGLLDDYTKLYDAAKKAEDERRLEWRKREQEADQRREEEKKKREERWRVVLSAFFENHYAGETKALRWKEGYMSLDEAGRLLADHVFDSVGLDIVESDEDFDNYELSDTLSDFAFEVLRGACRDLKEAGVKATHVIYASEIDGDMSYQVEFCVDWDGFDVRRRFWLSNWG